MDFRRWFLWIVCILPSVSIAQVDIAIGEIQPVDSLFCAYPSNEACVVISNLDTATIDSFQLEFSINGALSYGPTTIFSNLLPGADTTICLGPFAISSGDTLEFTVDMPNGVIDTIPSNNILDSIVNLAALPSINAGNDTLLCVGDTIAIGGAPTGPLGAMYTWFSIGYISDTSSSNPLVAHTTATSYYLYVTDTNGCEAFDSIRIEVNVPSIGIAGPDTFGCMFDSVQLGQPILGSIANYQWSAGSLLDFDTLPQPMAYIPSDTNFIIQVVDTFGCTFYDTVFVAALPLPTIDAGPDTVICPGDTITIGGNPTGPLGATYAWTGAGYLDNPVSSHPAVAPVSSTVYEVLGTDTMGCQSLDTVVVDIHALPVVFAGADDTVCFGDTIVLGGSPTGPVGSSYLWSPSAGINDTTIANPELVVVSSNQMYAVTVTDSNGCSAADTVLPTHFPSQFLAGPDVSVCIFDSTLIGLPISGAISSYTWSGAALLNFDTASQPLAYVLTDTSFFLQTTDTFGCSYIDTVFVTVNPLPVIDAGPDTTVCAFEPFILGGAPTGPAGSVYSWGPPGLFVDPTVANPELSVTTDTLVFLEVTDTNGCIAYDTVVINMHAIPAIDAGLDTFHVCSGETVQIGAAPTGAPGNSFAWSPATGVDDTTLANPTVTGQASQYYFVTVTEPLNGCTNYDTTFVNVRSLPSVDAGMDQEICIYDTIALGGGPTSPTAISFTWSPAAGLDFDTVPNPASFPIVDTDYILTVVDTFGCIAYDTVSVVVNPLPVVTFNNPAPFCQYDSTQLVASGGISYMWNNGMFLSDDQIANPIAFPLDTTTFVVTVTDSNNCVNEDSLVVHVHQLPLVDAGPDTSVCYGNTFQFTNAIAPNPIWSPAATLNNSSIINPTAFTLNTTEYFLVGTDGNGCSATDSVTLIVNPLPVVDAGADKVHCALDSIQLGGAPTSPTGVLFDWSNDALLDNDELPNPMASVSGLTTFIVAVTDANGCVNSDNVTVNILPLPTVQAFGTNPTDSFCPGTQVQLLATGASSYTWSPLVAISGANSNAPIVAPVVTTDYIVTGTALNGCKDKDTIAVNIFPQPSANAGPDQEICTGDTVQMAASGGAYYEWSPGNSLSNAFEAAPLAFPKVTTVYTVTVTDSHGCSAADQVKVVVNPLPVVSAGPDMRTCMGTGVKIGGTPTSSGSGASYLWQPAQWLNNNKAGNPIANPPATTDFTVVVTTTKGCMDSASMTVVVDTLPRPVVLGPLPVCLYDTSITVAPSGYVYYEWSPDEGVSDGPGDTVYIYSEDSAEYVLEVTDDNGCKGKDTILVAVHPLPALSMAGPLEACFGDTVIVEVRGGDNYVWSRPDSSLFPDSSRISVVARVDTVYQVIVTDSFGCSDSASVELYVHPLPAVDAGEDIDNCDLEFVILGGEPTGPEVAAYFWEPQTGLDNPYSANPTLFSPDNNTYFVTVEDVNGCSNTDSITVRGDCFPLIFAPTAFTPGQDNTNDEFKIVHQRILEPKLEIYDRYGRLVFETNDLDIGWNGYDLHNNSVYPAGVFAWKLRYKTEEGKKQSMDGKVTLVR